MLRLPVPSSHQPRSIQTRIAALERPDGQGLVGPEYAATLIRQGSVWDGKRRLSDPGELVGDEAWIAWPRLAIEPFVLAENQIVYADADLLIVWKPGGLNTCPSVYSTIDSLAHGVQAWLQAQGSDYQLNTINRLDRSTQGLVCFGRHKAAEKALHALFRDQKVTKHYVAATAPLPKDTHHFRFTDPVEWRGEVRSADTWVRRLGAAARLARLDPNLQWYLVWPQTGRTHQIRQHFARHLLPITGDSVYGAFPAGAVLQLYCVGYRFRHPFSGQVCRVNIHSDRFAKDF